MVQLRCRLLLLAFCLCYLGNIDARRHRSSRVAFSAVKTTNQKMSVNQDVIFDKVLLNKGYGFRPIGVFKAPRSGMYMLTSSLFHLKEELTIQFAIVHQGNVVANFHGTNDWEQFSQTVIIHVKKGETVSIRNVRNNNPTIYGFNFSTFSGYLL
ncbi:cerebellin-4-like [Mya arenaria]|uniref:cerebellin-4-like n=1 Tax=Mya arenaria TaxID=6604 RepID=UPI0022E5639F|nr:cerebellin-4-like [Mya arenaria]